MWKNKVFGLFAEPEGVDPSGGGGGQPPADPGGGGSDPAPSGGGPGGQPSGGEPGGGEPSGGQPPADPGGQPPADPGGQPQQSFLSTLPEGWRNELVEQTFEDPEKKQRAQSMLERVPDMKTLTQNYVEAQERIRKGELSNGLPENPSEEQLKEWREAQGIPEKPEDYQVEPGEGLTLSSEDERIMEHVKAVAHQNNISQTALNELTGAMLKAREAEYDAIQNQDGIDSQQAARQLKESWGPDYERNINTVKGLIAQMPEDLRDDFQQARLPDGTALFNKPSALVFFADVAHKANPANTVVPSANNPVQAIKDEIKELEAQMGTEEWYKDEQKQQRYQELIRAQERMEAQDTT